MNKAAENAIHVKFDGSVIVSEGEMPGCAGQFVAFYLTDKKRAVGANVGDEERGTAYAAIAFQFESVGSVDVVIKQLRAARKKLAAQRAKESEE